MSLNVTPTQTRALLPFSVRLMTDETSATVTIRPTGGKSSEAFRLPLNKATDGTEGFKGTFWLENPGPYEVVYKTGTGEQVVPIHVDPQVYLSFGKEFGYFSILFVIVMTGIALWVRRIRRQNPA